MSPGDLVVCVNNGPVELGFCVARILKQLEVGRVYAVRERRAYKFLGRRIEGIIVDDVDGWFLAERFRPVRPTSIESLREILKQAPVRVPHPSDLESVS
jgi:hypothetical protein